MLNGGEIQKQPVNQNYWYQVSPLRDGSFQPNSANAGSLIAWMEGVGEKTWLQGAALLAGLLATNLAIVLWQWSEPKGSKVSRFFRLMFWVGGGAIVSILLYLGLGSLSPAAAAKCASTPPNAT
jgi:hypothetical protein